LVAKRDKGESVALDESIAQDILKEIRASSNVLGAVLLEKGEIKFSTLPDVKIGLIKLIARRLEDAGQPGDFIVKRLTASSLIVMRGPSLYVLSIEGRGPEGLLISTANRLMSLLVENLSQSLSEPGSSNSDLDYPSSPMSFSLDAVPIIKPSFSAEVAMDINTLKILRYINGLNSLRTLIRISGLEEEEVFRIITKLFQAGIIHIGGRGREAEDKVLLRLAKVPYELDERFTRPEEALKMLGDADEILRFLTANLHKGLTALEYKRLADEVGLGASLLSIIRALESLRSMGIAKRKGEKRPPGELARRDIPRTAISVLLTTMH